MADEKRVGETPILTGLTAAQHQELQDMLKQLIGLWSQLTDAAGKNDAETVARIRREIDYCRARVEAIKRSGTVGSA